MAGGSSQEEASFFAMQGNRDSFNFARMGSDYKPMRRAIYCGFHGPADAQVIKNYISMTTGHAEALAVLSWVVRYADRGRPFIAY